MNNKGKTNTVVILIVVAVAVIGLFLVFGGKGILPTSTGDITNGYWNVEAQECRISEDIASGEVFNAQDLGGDINTNFQCCFNAAFQQVDCNDPSELLGPFAIYDGQTGKFGLVYGFVICNKGNVALTNAWIDSSKWTKDVSSLATPTAGQIAEFDTAFAGIVGSEFGVALPVYDDCVPYSTTIIDLQVVGGEPTGEAIAYNWELITKATAVGLPETPKTQTSVVTIQKEGIQFDVEITTGLT